MSYWYYFNAPSPSSSNKGAWSEEINVTNPPVYVDGMIQGTAAAPMSKLSITMQYDVDTFFGTNTQRTRISEISPINTNYNLINRYSYARSGYSTTYENTRRVLGRLYRSTSPVTTAGMLNVGSVMPGTTISGKYKLKYSTVSEMTYGGSDIPVSFQVNGQYYDHWIFPCWTTGYDGWDLTLNTSAGANMFYVSTNRRCFGGYRTDDIADPDFAPTFFTVSYNDATYATGIEDAVFDFGSSPQEVPEFFKTWIDTNFDGIYENTYAVRNPDGDVLASVSDAPPMTSALLTVVGDHKTLTLTGINSSTYTLEWDSTTPANMMFAGLAGSVSGSVIIPVATSTTVSWQSSTTMWERYIKYHPPATTFTVTLYQCTAENIRVDKSNYLTAVMTLHGALREECSILTPVILIETDQVPTANYARIQIWNRYYYITGIRSIRKNLWEISMSVDALMSYRTAIGALTAIVDRNETATNNSVPDPLLPSYPDKDVEYYEFTNTAMKADQAITNPYIMVVVGGST